MIRNAASCDACLNYLKAGAADDPVSLLRIANVDLLKDETYEAAGRMIGNLIDEFITAVSVQK